MSSSKRMETKLIHAGEMRPRVGGAVNLPIFQSATFEYGGEDDYHDIRYIRLNNTPNHIVLGEKLAAIESAESGLVAASGMAIISTTLLSILRNGDHILLQDCLYGGTHDFVTKDLPGLGIDYDFIDGSDPASWEKKIRKQTKAIYVEAIANPLMDVPELAAVVEFARANKIISIIDNTFASPINFRPAELGFDLSLHSCTKYLNGHSDIVAGACIGKAALVKDVKRKLNHLGGTMDPHAAFLLHRGMKTLSLRVKHQNESAQKIAEYLEKHADIGAVNYPGLESHSSHARAAKWFDGFGGMLSFELKDQDADKTDEFLKALQLPICAPSLGGVESLITRPATTSHLGLSKEDRKKIGISDSLVRFSTGIEATEDLIEDFEQALKKISAKVAR